MPPLHLPETDLRRIVRYCDASVPPSVRDQVRLEHHVRGRSVTICETRAPLCGEGQWTHQGLAQLRYRDDLDDWTLHWADRNSRWHEYHQGNVFSGSVAELLAEIDADPTCIFNG
jgi:hypothetical protein